MQKVFDNADQLVSTAQIIDQHDSGSRPGYSEQFSYGSLWFGDDCQHVGGHNAVEASAGKSEVLGVHLHKVYAAMAGLVSFASGFAEHPMAVIEPDHFNVFGVILEA